MDCDNMCRKISQVVSAEVGEMFAFLSPPHRKSLWYNGIWSCEGEKATVDVKPLEVSRKCLQEDSIWPSRLLDSHSFLADTLFTG